MLAACASAPSVPDAAATAAATLPALPDRWSTAQPAQPSTAADTGWQGFGDPLLPRLIADALRANTDLQTASAALARARALRDLAAAGVQPQVGLNGSVSANRGDGSSSRSLRGGLDASWEIDLFGAGARADDAASAELRATDATLQATRLAVAGETALAYLAWQGTRQQLEVARASLASQEQSLQLAQWRNAAGLVDALDTEQARAAVDQARSRVPALQATLEQTEHRLAVLVGQAPTTLRAGLEASPRAAMVAPQLPSIGVPAELLRRRYDIQAAESRVASSLATLAQRRAERLPSFSISGSLLLQAASLSALSGPGALIAGLAAGVNWPLFDGGAGAAQVAAQQAALDSARASYRGAVLTALQDVEDNLVAIASGNERIASLQRASAAADEALRLARLRYSAGVADFGVLLDSERTALSAADTLASARTELASAHVRLVKALGGGWSAPAIAARQPPSTDATTQEPA